MNLELSAEQRLLQATLARLFAEQSTPARIRECEPLGFDRTLWQALWAMEVPRLRVPHESDASLLHAVLVAEEAGRHLASVPLIETIAVQRLLAQLDVGGDSALAWASAGERVVSLALHDLRAAPAQMLPSGAIAEAVLGLDGDSVWLLRDLSRHADHTASTHVHGSIPACRLDHLQAATRHRVAHPGAVGLLRAAIEEWRLLNAAQVAAAGRKALELAAAYAGERQAFGRKIGEFQGVSHPLADSCTDLEGARLLCWRATDALARSEPGAAALIAMAAWWCGAAARPAALRAMRVFGGYGMTMEHDAQLYFRRINGWSLCIGTPDHDLDRIADRLWSAESRIDLPAAGEVVIDFGWGVEGDAAATRMRGFCDERDDDAMRRFMHESVDGFDAPLYRQLATAGLLYPDAPAAYGGPGLTATAAAAVRDAYGDYYWNLLASSVSDMVAKTVLYFGSDIARREILPRLYAGETYCTLGYSEPSGGSDIFAARTTATRDGDDWLINGQKRFTSTAHLAD
jgi:alkylation response protein AidB-like acyl-CoA dehydrogenase